MKHHDPTDETVTHFMAKEKRSGGFFITLYRFRKSDYPDKRERPQYRGPLGWKFHMQQKDEDVIPLLRPIEELPEVTGDNLVERKFNPQSMYAG